MSNACMLADWLGTHLLITLVDGRQYTGLLVAVDSARNILLRNAEALDATGTARPCGTAAVSLDRVSRVFRRVLQPIVL